MECVAGLMLRNLHIFPMVNDLFEGQLPLLSMQERLGFLPTSIWEPDPKMTSDFKALVGDTGETRTSLDGSLGHQSDSPRRAGDKGCWHGQKSPFGFMPYASVFNPHLAAMILSAYAPLHAKIYDPFAGGGTRGFIATAMGHTYHGRELRQEEVSRIIARQHTLGVHFLLAQGDAREIPPAKGYYTFSYTCPPYHNLEIYSDDKADLSTIPSYPDFLSQLALVFSSLYQSLTPGSFAVWVVGNFRDSKTGALRHFNGDCVRLATEVGFLLWDELIWKGACGAALSRVGQFEANRKAVRIHEYILVFKK